MGMPDKSRPILQREKPPHRTAHRFDISAVYLWEVCLKIYPIPLRKHRCPWKLLKTKPLLRGAIMRTRGWKGFQLGAWHYSPRYERGIVAGNDVGWKHPPRRSSKRPMPNFVQSPVRLSGQQTQNRYWVRSATLPLHRHSSTRIRIHQALRWPTLPTVQFTNLKHELPPPTRRRT